MRIGKIKGIFGNEIAVILGMDKNKTVKELYLEKLQKISENQEELYKRKEAVYWDDTLREILCKEFTIRSGKKVRKELKIVVDEEYDFMHCKVDRRIVGENSILLCSIYSGVKAYEEINKSVLLECQHNMRVTRADKCYVACLINDKRFIFKEIRRDEKLINKIIEQEKKFYDNMVKEIPLA